MKPIIYCVIFLLLILMPLYSITEYSMTNSITPIEKVIVSEYIFFSDSKPYKVYINNQFIGITPLFVSDFPEGEIKVRLEGLTRYVEVILEIDPAKQGITMFKPDLTQNYTNSIQVATKPDGASLYLDNILIGTTPLRITDIGMGEHQIQLILDNYMPVTEFVVLKKDKPIESEFQMTRAYKVIFSFPLPDEAEVNISGKDFKSVYKSNSPVWLVNGEYIMKISGKSFAPKEEKIVINEGNVTIDFKPDYYRPRIVLSSLLPESSVFLNDVDVTKKIVNNSIETPAGECRLAIKKDKYLDFEASINVLLEKETPVAVIYLRDLGPIKQNNRIIGYSMLGGGALVTVAGLVFNNDDILISAAGDYNEYKTYKLASLGIIGTGMAVLAGSLIFFLNS